MAIVKKKTTTTTPKSLITIERNNKVDIVFEGAPDGERAYIEENGAGFTLEGFNFYDITLHELNAAAELYEKAAVELRKIVAERTKK